MMTTPGTLAMPLLQVDEVTIEYRSGRQLVTATDQVSFVVHQADRFVILGPSGCGKSTLLKAVAGFIRPVAGRLLLNGTEISGPGPDRVVVFQEFDQLLPWKTVKENIVFALTATRRLSRQDAGERAMDFLSRVRLTGFADSYPHTLSGGMKQRVAIARALAVEPQVLLMDEPFAALDALSRVRMQEELLQLWEDTRFTVLFVTHSIEEAIRVGTRILLLTPHPGRVRAEVPGGADRTDANGTLLSIRIHQLLFEEGDRPAVAGAGHPPVLERNTND